VFFIPHAGFHVIREIGTTDVWIILDFDTMEHTKVRSLVGSQKTTFVCSLE
jgi:hypothetical protein